MVHDLTAALRHCDKALLLGNGRARFGTPRDVLTTTNLVDHHYMSKGQADWIEGMRAAPRGWSGSMFDWADYAFMKRAVVATTVLSFSVAPVGAFLVLRRLSLAGEAMAHAIVPGIVIAFVAAGLSVYSMIVGGLIAGVGVALLTSVIARSTIMREDASLASLYLVALALGIFILSASGSAVPLKASCSAPSSASITRRWR